jgi:hypothetical protein
VASVRKSGIIRAAILLLAAMCLPVSTVYAAPDAVPPSYASIDEHALKAPASAEASVESLAAYLTSDAKTDIEKARAIFRWITARIHFDSSALESAAVQEVDASQVLKTRRTACMGYSETFYILGRAAGLEVERIAGLARACSTANDSLCNSPPNHEWNAVKINGKWMLLDCTWSTGYMESSTRFVKRYDDYYFCTPPEQFIFDHFPVDPDRQLLPKPMSCREYEQLVTLKPEFFKYGLELDTHRQSSIKATGPVEIDLIARRDVVMLARLTCGKGEVSDSYTLVEKEGDHLKITAGFPRPGSYTLRLYAKPGNSDGNYVWVADYQIDVTSLSKPCQRFPESLAAFIEHDARLMSPRIGRLEGGTSQQFRLAVPGAKVVAVIAGKKWSYLQRDGDVFEGTVEVTDEPMQVCVNFGNSREYQVLLTYNKTATP